MLFIILQLKKNNTGPYTVRVSIITLVKKRPWSASVISSIETQFFVQSIHFLVYSFIFKNKNIAFTESSFYRYFFLIVKFKKFSKMFIFHFVNRYIHKRSCILTRQHSFAKINIKIFSCFCKRIESKFLSFCWLQLLSIDSGYVLLF